MGFRIGRDTDFKVSNFFKTGHQIRCVVIAIWMGGITGLAPRGIAAQCDYMFHARIPIPAGHIINLATGRTDAGQMRGRHQICFFLYADQRVVSTLPSRTTRPIGDRHKIRLQRRQTFNGRP